MERLRKIADKLPLLPVYLFISSDYVFCFNERNRTQAVDEESFRLSPVSYGCQKACVELMVCDYTRKGWAVVSRSSASSKLCDCTRK